MRETPATSPLPESSQLPGKLPPANFPGGTSGAIVSKPSHMLVLRVWLKIYCSKGNNKQQFQKKQQMLYSYRERKTMSGKLCVPSTYERNSYFQGCCIFSRLVIVTQLNFSTTITKKIEKVPTHTSSGNATVPSSVECQKKRESPSCSPPKKASQPCETLRPLSVAPSCPRHRTDVVESLHPNSLVCKTLAGKLAWKKSKEKKY